MHITRRGLAAGLASLAASTGAAGATVANPQLRRLQRGAAKVWIFGFAEARDRSWLTPKVEAALDESTTLWVEVPPLQPTAQPSPVIAERGYDRDHDLFEVLPKVLSERVLALAPQIGLTRERLAPMRPWLARQAIQRAFAASKAAAPSTPGNVEYPDQVIIARMRARGVPIRSEIPDLDALLRHFADYPTPAQIEDLQNLLDFIRDDRGGVNEDAYDWVTGRPSLKFIDRMRLETPALFAASHTERNRWWAAQVEAMLKGGGVSFVLVGMNHVLGPESIPVNLQRRGLDARMV